MPSQSAARVRSERTSVRVPYVRAVRGEVRHRHEQPSHGSRGCSGLTRRRRLADRQHSDAVEQPDATAARRSRYAAGRRFRARRRSAAVPRARQRWCCRANVALLVPRSDARRGSRARQVANAGRCHSQGRSWPVGSLERRSGGRARSALRHAPLDAGPNLTCARVGIGGSLECTLSLGRTCAACHDSCCDLQGARPRSRPRRASFRA